MNLTSSRLPLRRATAAAAALSLALVLSACGDDETPADEPTTAATDAATDEPEEPTEPTETAPAASTVLTEEQLSSALLTVGDLPPGYVVEEDDEEEGDDDSGGFEGSCLEEIGELTDGDEFDAEEDVEVELILEGDAGQSSVQSQVESYADEEQISNAIALFSEAVGACTEASGTTEDGLDYELEVKSDQTVSLSGVDEQARVAVSGTFSAQGQQFPVEIGFNVARIANNLVAVSTFDFGDVGESIVEQTDPIAQISVDRLADITG